MSTPPSSAAPRGSRTSRLRTLSVVAIVLVGLLGLAGCGDDAGSGTDTLGGRLNGSGATFPKTFYEVAIYEFLKQHKATTITYSGGGSGKGRTDLQEDVVDWAGSDGPVKDADRSKYKGGDFLYFPTVIAPITVAYKLSGVSELNLSPATIAKIFQRDIRTWNDPAIVAENPKVADKLKGDITVAHRSDGSGTTENFTKFLEKAVCTNAGGTWRLKSGSTVDWPADTQAGNGNAGVSQIVQDTKGAIGYVDYSDAVATDMKFASVANKTGAYIAPTLAAASAAAEGATINDDLSYDPLWADGATAYPITAPTWILVYVKQDTVTQAETLREFLRFMLTDAQGLADSVDYAKIPASLATRAITQLDRITAA